MIPTNQSQPAVGSAPTGPAPADAQQPNPVKIALPEDGTNSFEMWKARIQASKDLIDAAKPDWEANQKRYLVKAAQDKNSEAVVVPKDYANVEQKKALLFFQTPEVQLEPQQPGLEEAVPVFEAFLNQLLGADGVNAMAMVEEVLTDALCPAGIFVSKIAYEAVTQGMKDIQVGMEPDPTAPPQPAMPAGVLGLSQPQPVMRPKMESVPNIISERYIWDRIDPLKLLIPREFKGSDYDRASYLGHEFTMEFPRAKRLFNLPDDFNTFIAEDDRVLGKDNTAAGAEKAGETTQQRVRGWEIFYHAAAFDESEPHPDKIRVLVIIEGMDAPVRHEDSPYQRTTPDGQLIGMMGFPIHAGALRFVSGTALPPSDCQMSRFIVEELSDGRTQMKLQRKRNTPMRFGDLGRIGGAEALAKIERNVWQSIIPIEAGGSKNDPPIWEMERAHMPSENFQFDAVGNRDLAQTWALDFAQTGVGNDHMQTATEVSVQQQNSNVRLDKERNRFLNWFVAGVGKLAALVQLFADDQQYVRVLGSDGQARLQQWDKTTVAGKYVYKIKPNSSQRVDVTQDRGQFLQAYNLLAPSPFINQAELITQLVRKFDMDPTKLITQPQQKPTEIPKITFAFKGDDLVSVAPQFPIVVEILRQGGIAIDDQAIQEAQNVAIRQGAPAPVVAGAVSHGPATPPPPGGAPQPQAQASSPVNKHQTERTGASTGPKVGPAAGVGPR